MRKLECRHLCFAWGQTSNNPVDALRGVSFCAENGQIVGVLGPSGSGKSTLLQIIAGLEIPSEGEVYLDGDAITGPSARVGMVFQEPALFPWLTVRGNVEFGCRMRGMGARDRGLAATGILDRVGLHDWAERYPHELSGGMKQRVAVARALVVNPEVVLMDEPFAALDFQTRLLMGQFVLNVRQAFQKTIIFVTHSIDEAIALSDKVVVMTTSPGRVLDEVPIDLEPGRDLTSPQCNEYRALFVRMIESQVTFPSGESKVSDGIALQP